MKAVITLILVAALAACACSTNTKTDTKTDYSFTGIDVSHHQGKIDWKTVSESYQNIEFVYIKGTEGATYTDPQCLFNAREAKKNGLKIGIYHYFRMTSSPESQFANYKKMMSIANPDLIPMVDIETGDGYPISEVKKNINRFLMLIEKEYGQKPIIYGTNRSYNELCAPEFNNLLLYIGRYGENKPIINGPSHYNIWQYSDKAVIKGIEKPADVCRFHPDNSIEDFLLN